MPRPVSYLLSALPRCCGDGGGKVAHFDLSVQAFEKVRLLCLAALPGLHQIYAWTSPACMSTSQHDSLPTSGIEIALLSFLPKLAEPGLGVIALRYRIVPCWYQPPNPAVRPKLYHAPNTQPSWVKNEHRGWNWTAHVAGWVRPRSSHVCTLRLRKPPGPLAAADPSSRL